MEQKDTELEKLKLLFDYTKFHIGLYTAVATIMAALIASKESRFTFNWKCLAVSIFLLAIAGFAGGVIASSIPGYGSYEVFWEAKIGPLRWRAFKAEYWTYIEHASFWVSIFLALLSLVMPP
jgi:hypothetical protein